MTGVSRRNFVTLAGAGVALGACNVTDAKTGTPAVGTGTSPHHGTFAYKQKPAGNNVPAFEPEFLTAVYLRFGSKGNKHAFVARHGYAQFPKGAPSDVIQKLAEQELAAAQKPNGQWQRKNDLAAKKWRREDNLDKFDFDGQNIIFILLDNEKDEYRFDDRIEKGTTDTRANLVRFTHYAGQADANEIEYAEVEPNNAFVNARLIDGSAAGPFRGKKILRIENWYVDKDGNALQSAAKLRYSMNLHLLATTEGNKLIPIVIDPDTGNGMGNGPP